MAIRNNVVGTHNMRKEMVAVLYHYTGFKMQEQKHTRDICIQMMKIAGASARLIKSQWDTEI